MVKVVVWDIGRVLMEWEPEAYYDRAIGQDRRKALFDAVDLHEMNKSIDLGVHSREAAYALADKTPEWAPEIRRWHDNWLEMAAPEITASANLLRKVKERGMRCVSLTNFGANTMLVAQEAYPALTLFDAEYVSGRLGEIKPNPPIYAALEAGEGLAGADLLYTDDSPANIAAAATRGWKTHLFEGAEGWGERLIAEGVLLAEDLP